MSEDLDNEGLCVDIDTGIVRRDRVLVQRTPIATLFIGFGAQSERLRDFACGDEEDRDPFIVRCREIDRTIEQGGLAKAHHTDLPRSAFNPSDRVLRRLAVAEALAKAGFNPDEPRDERGRWTREGDEEPALQEGRSVAVTTVAASAAADDFADTLEGWGGWSFGSVGREALAALGRFAAGALPDSAAGAITALGVLIIPTNRDTTSRGTLRDRPDISYTFDAPAGVLTLSRNGEVFYAGRLQGGAFRTIAGASSDACSTAMSLSIPRSCHLLLRIITTKRARAHIADLRRKMTAPLINPSSAPIPLQSLVGKAAQSGSCNIKSKLPTCHAALMSNCAT